MEGPVDLGVTSYLTDPDGNVIVGPNTTPPPKKMTPARAGAKQKPRGEVTGQRPVRRK